MDDEMKDDIREAAALYWEFLGGNRDLLVAVAGFWSGLLTIFWLFPSPSVGVPILILWAVLWSFACVVYGLRKLRRESRLAKRLSGDG